MLKRALSRQFSNISHSSVKLSESSNASRSSSPTLQTDIDSDQDLLEMLCSDVFATNVNDADDMKSSPCGSPISMVSDHYSGCIECQIEEVLTVDDATALSCLMEYANVNCATLLKMPESKGDRGTIFHRCVVSLAFLCTRMLLATGECNVNAKTSKRFETSLHVVVRKFRPGKLSPQVLKMVEVLLEAGAEVNSINYNGRTPLHMAAERGSVAATKRLCEAGAMTDVKDSQGKTPLDGVIKSDATGQLVAQVLLSYQNLKTVGKTKVKENENLESEAKVPETKNVESEQEEHDKDRS